jgi:hypothetical protein
MHEADDEKQRLGDVGEEGHLEQRRVDHEQRGEDEPDDCSDARTVMFIGSPPSGAAS